MDGSNWNFEIELVGARIGNWDSAELELKGERRERSFLSRVYRVIIECLSSVYPVSIQCLPYQCFKLLWQRCDARR